MALRNDPQSYVARTFDLVSKKKELTLETQLKIAKIIGNNDLLISNATKEQACLVLGVVIQNDQRISVNVISFLNNFSSQHVDEFACCYSNYVLCAYVQWYSQYFLMRKILDESYWSLKKINNIEIQNWIIWAYATQIKYDSGLNLQQKHIEFLEELLIVKATSCSVSYIIRKMTEYNNKRIEQVSEKLWYLLTEIVHSDEYDIGTYRNTFCALANFFSSKYTEQVSNKCQQRIANSLEESIVTKNVSKDILNTIIRALKYMILTGRLISETTSSKLNDLLQDDDQYVRENAKTVLNILNDNGNDQHKSDIPRQHCCHVKIEKIAAIKTTTVARSQETSVKPEVKFTNLETIMDMNSDCVQSEQCQADMEYQPHTHTTGDHLSIFRTTVPEIRHLLRLTEQNKVLTTKDINFLCRACTIRKQPYSSSKEKIKVYELIVKTFHNSAKNGQHHPIKVMELLVDYLTISDPSSKLILTCSETFWEMVKHKQIIPQTILGQLQDKLLETDNPAVRKIILNVLAINMEKKSFDINIPLETLEKDLSQSSTCLSTSYIFLRAVLTENKKLSEQTFKIICYITSLPPEENFNIDARRNCMAVIAYSIKNMDERQSLVETIQFCLTKAFEGDDERICSMALTALCFYCEVACITHFRPPMLNNTLYHILNEKFENLSTTDLQNITSIYLQAASKRRILSNEVLVKISILLKISPDFKIRHNVIGTLEYVTETSNSIILPFDVLANVKIALDDPEISIRTIAVNTFLKNWKRSPVPIFKKSETSITPLLMHKFHVDAQKSTLSILKDIVQQKNELSNNLIQIIGQFLFNPDAYIVSTAAEILLYQAKCQTLSQNMIDIVERTLYNRSNQEILIQILRKCTLSQCILKEMTLIMLGDVLFDSEDELQRNNIVSTLEFADRNQSLPEIINDLLGCEYYTKLLKNSESQTELEYAEQQLIRITSSGRRLSKGILKTIQELLSRSERQTAILKMIADITSNGQSLTNNMIEILSNFISQTTSINQVSLIKIFRNLIKNNQTPPNTFFKHLHNFIFDASVNTDIIYMYTILLERNINSLDPVAINKIYQLLENPSELNLELKRTISVFLKQAIESDIVTPKPELLMVLLESGNISIQNNTIQMIHYLVKTKQYILSDNILYRLHQMSINETILEIFEKALQIQNLPIDIKERLELVCSQNMFKDMNSLEKLKLFVSHGQILLKRHFSQLSNLLYSSVEEERILASEILGIVASSEQSIPNEVIEVVSMNLLDETILPNTLHILDKAFQSGWKANERTISDLTNLATGMSTNNKIKNLTRDLLRKHNIVDYLIIEDYLLNIVTSNNEQVETLIKNHRIKIPDEQLTILYDQLKKQLSTETKSKILNKLQCAVYNNQFLCDNLLCCISDDLFKINKEIVVTILIKVLENGQVVSEDVIYAIEKAFLTDTNELTLHLIRELTNQYTVFQNNTIQHLIDNTKTYHEAALIIETIAEYQQLPCDTIRPYLEENLSSDDMLKVRSSFIVLQHQITEYYNEELFELVTKITLPNIIDQNKLISEISSMKEYLGIVRTLLSIEYYQVSIFNTYPVKQWPRECLCIDLLARMQMESNQSEVITFYQNLSNLEETKGYELYDEERDHILQFFIDKHAEMNMNKINEILIMLEEVCFSTLKLNSSNWYDDLIQTYIEQQLIKTFPESKCTHISMNHMTDLLFDTYNNYQSIDLLNSIFHSYSEPNQLVVFNRFISDHQITIEEMNDALYLSKRTTTSLEKELKMKIISKTLRNIWRGPEDLVQRADDFLRKLSIKWSFENLLEILRKIQETSTILEDFIHYLTIIYNYGIHDNLVEQIGHILTGQQSNKCYHDIYKLAIDHCFPVTNSIEKSIEQLIEELIESNRKDAMVLTFINENKLRDIIQKSQNISLQNSSLANKSLIIDQWDKNHIKKWSAKIQSDCQWAKNWKNLPEIIAVIQRAFYLDRNCKIRHVQLMAVLLLLTCNEESRGRLAQIATGEGKSTIISILAVIKTLQGQYVDIVTSSTVLAQRDAEEKAPFYNMFNLTVSHNGDDHTLYTSGAKECYKSSIVYGDVSHFQFDVLRQEFSLLDTRGKRPFGVVIIDEVDCMLIDENNKIARLADYIPGMEYLNHLFYAIWQAIQKSELEEASYKYALIQQMKTLILDKNAQIIVPKHLQLFAINQLSLWIENAFIARDRYQLECNYMIKPDEQRINRITPIDFSNTGIIQAHTTLSDGLQQFLELKHGLKLTSLNMTTNFLSNIGLFNRYKDKMFGLTGTLGSQDAKQLLCEVYSVDTIILPKYRQVYYIELPGIILAEEKSWIETIVQSTMEEVQRNRSVLIICETRADAVTIFKELRRKYLTAYLYTDNTDRNELNIVDNQVKSGDIIVATNLAGRGTDLKTSQEVENNGGLHVCLTFLPINTRVEQQAFGRTARQGNRGTSQLILNRKNILPYLLPNYFKLNDQLLPLLEEHSQTIEGLRCLYRQIESDQLKNIQTKDIPEIKLKDELFQEFCQLLGSLREIDADEFKLNSVKERWGLWLKYREQREKIKNSLADNITAAGFRLIDGPSTSLYDVVQQQLKECRNATQLKKQIIKHIIKNQNYYEDFLKNIDNNSRLLYIENTLMQALMRTINVNIILFNSYESTSIIYKRQNADRTICLGTDGDLSFYSVAIDNNSEHILSELLADVDEDEVTVVRNMILPLPHQNQELYEKLNRVFQQQEYRMDYFQFEQEIRCQYNDENKIIQNPFYYLTKADILIGRNHTFLARTKQFMKNVLTLGIIKLIERKKALRYLNTAIELDPIFSFTAYVDRAYLIIIEQENAFTYKAEAINDLVKARDQINDTILPIFYSMKVKLSNDSNDYLDNNELSIQLGIKIDIIQLYMNHIQNAILIIENSQKLVDIKIINGQKIITQTNVERRKASKFLDHSNKNIFKQFLCDNISSEIYKLSFHNILAYNDMGPKDQGIDLLNLMKPDYSNVSIHFQQITRAIAMEVIQGYEGIIQHGNLRVDSLNQEELLNLVNFVLNDETKMDLDINAEDSEQYQLIIQNTTGIITIATSMQESLKFSTKEEALNYLMQNVDKPIVFITINAVNVQFFDVFPTMSFYIKSFSLTFNKLSSTKILEIIKTLNKPVSIEFTGLTINKAKKIIKIRKERDFLIGLDKLSSLKTKQILEKFDPAEQNVDVYFKRIEEHYLSNDKPDEELNELDSLGINRLIIINELTPTPWLSIMTIAALGTAQIIGGVLLNAFTCGIGHTLGTSLIVEGIGDLYFAFQGVISRNINFKEYAIQKGISLALCIVTLGTSTVTQSFRTTKNIGTKSTSQLVKRTWIEARKLVQTSFKTIGQEIVGNTAKTSLRTVCKDVAIITAKTGAKEVLNYSTDYILSNHLLLEIKAELATYIESSMNEIIDTDMEYKRILGKVFINDLLNQNHKWQNQMEQIAVTILNTSSEFIGIVKSFANGTSNALLNSLQTKNTTISNILNVTEKGCDFIKFMNEILKHTKLTKIFFNSYKIQLLKLENDIPDLKELFSEREKIDLRTTKAIFHILEENNIFNKNGFLNLELYSEDESENIIEKCLTDEPINDHRFSTKKLRAAVQKINLHVDDNDYKNVVLHFISPLLRNTYQESIFKKKLHKLLLDQFMAFIQGVFIGPIKNFVIGNMSKNIWDKMERNLSSNNTTSQEQSECEHQERYINAVSNEFIADIRSGKIELKSNIKEELENIIKKPEKDRNQMEKFIVTVLDDKPGGIIERSLVAAMTRINKESNQTTNQNFLDRQNPDIFTSSNPTKKQLTEFMLTNPTYIARIMPAFNIINSNVNHIRRSIETNNTKIKPESLRFNQSHNSGPIVINATKKLFNFLNSNSREITQTIGIAQKLFPRQILLKLANSGNQCVALIVKCNHIKNQCQKKIELRTVAEVWRAGHIIISIVSEWKT